MEGDTQLSSAKGIEVHYVSSWGAGILDRGNCVHKNIQVGRSVGVGL